MFALLHRRRTIRFGSACDRSASFPNSQPRKYRASPVTNPKSLVETVSELSLYQSVSPANQLSPITRYAIGKLLRQFSSHESPELMAFKTQLSQNNCACLDEVLRNLYSDELELAQVILQLDNLVYFYTTLNSQVVLYAEQEAQLAQVQNQIFQLFGFSQS